MESTSWFAGFIESKWGVALVSAFFGWLIAKIETALRSNIRTLEYTVKHEHVALAGDDPLFGSIRVTWQGNPVTNLYLSTVTLVNSTGRNLKNLNIEVYSGKTDLLGERTSFEDTSFILKWSEEFKQRLAVVPGESPTSEQLKIHQNSRGYHVPVLNRGQRIKLTYLTSAPASTDPNILLDMQHEGLSIKYKQLEREIHGVPVTRALTIGIISCLIVLVAVVSLSKYLILPVSIAMIAGLFAQSIGAIIYRVGIGVKDFISASR